MDVYLLHEIITDADPRVTDIILNARSVCVLGCDLSAAPMLWEYLSAGLDVVAEADV